MNERTDVLRRGLSMYLFSSARQCALMELSGVA